MFDFDEEIDIEAIIVEEHERTKIKRGDRIYRQRSKYRGHTRKNFWYRNPRYRRWLKKNCERKVRRTRVDHLQFRKGNSYKKISEFWWGIY